MSLLWIVSWGTPRRQLNPKLGFKLTVVHNRKVINTVVQGEGQTELEQFAAQNALYPTGTNDDRHATNPDVAKLVITQEGVDKPLLTLTPK